MVMDALAESTQIGSRMLSRMTMPGGWPMKHMRRKGGGIGDNKAEESDSMCLYRAPHRARKWCHIGRGRPAA